MATHKARRLARLNKALAAASGDPTGDQVKFSKSLTHPSQPQQANDPDDMMRKCEVCGNMFPSLEMPTINVGDLFLPLYLCHGCIVLTPAQRANHKAPYWSAILKHWKIDVDPRASAFVFLEQNSLTLLCCLHELAMHYSWDEVTIMVNSMVTERMRHCPTDYGRFAIETDFFDVYQACKHMKFYHTIPEALQADELKNFKLILSPFGLVMPEPGVCDDEMVDNRCSFGWSCPNILPCRDRIIFTYAYRNRRGCGPLAAESDESN